MIPAVESLGRYEIVKHLASGGMGEVFVAVSRGQVGSSVPVAVKVLRPELAKDPSIVKMLIDEAKISMVLQHQNIVSVTDFLDEHGTYAIVMEYVQGVTVERLLDAHALLGKRLELALGLYIGVELCRALKYAHTRTNDSGEPLNIVHRDVTPANVLLSLQGEVKLTDFGIARARGRLQETAFGILKGRFGYLAPEMTRYEEIDARADLFSLGVMLYLLCAGRHPVADVPVMEAILKYEQKKIAPPSAFNAEIPPQLDEIIMRALDPNPQNRWQSAQELGARLTDVMMRNPAWRNGLHGADALARAMLEVLPEISDEVRVDLSGPTAMEEPSKTDEIPVVDVPTEDIEPKAPTTAPSLQSASDPFAEDESTQIDYEQERDTLGIKLPSVTTVPSITTLPADAKAPRAKKDLADHPADETLPDSGPKPPVIDDLIRRRRR